MARISRLDTKLPASKTGLIMFDALNGYLHPKDPAKAQFLAERDILPNMQRLIAGARAVGMTVFYPSGAHAADGSDTVERLTDTDMELRTHGKGAHSQSAFGEGARTIKPPYYAGSWEAQVADEIAPAAGDVFIPKHRWNSFFQTDLELQLRVRGIETIVICGGSTDVGIASTVFAARDLDYGIVVVSDCCYSMRGDNNAFFLTRVFPRMGRIMTADEAVALMTE